MQSNVFLPGSGAACPPQESTWQVLALGWKHRNPPWPSAQTEEKTPGLTRTDKTDGTGQDKTKTMHPKSYHITAYHRRTHAQIVSLRTYTRGPRECQHTKKQANKKAQLQQQRSSAAGDKLRCIKKPFAILYNKVDRGMKHTSPHPTPPHPTHLSTIPTHISFHPFAPPE